MPIDHLDGLWTLIILLLPFLFIQRHLHREIQSVFLLITHRPDISLALFSLVFFPGVLIHEGSHFLMAHLLRVRTGGFSLIPKPLEDGRVQLGYVETVQADFLRDALIGLAPFLSGGLIVAWVGFNQLELQTLLAVVLRGGEGDVAAQLRYIYTKDDFWLWFYLIVTISSTMLPSQSDRRAWLPVGLVIGGLLGIGLLAGAGPWMAQNLLEPLNAVLRAISMVFAISLGVHLVLILPFLFLRRVLEELTRQKIS
jgi:hypothetical protein